jgi:hypothetical protein
MNFLDWLSAGSDDHKAMPLQVGKSFTIRAANDSSEGRQRFDEIVRRAKTRSHAAEGYSILPHRDNMRGGSGNYDYALILVEE